MPARPVWTFDELERLVTKKNTHYTFQTIFCPASIKELRAEKIMFLEMLDYYERHQTG
ncbi:hypothetical protein NYE33_13010 [Paenibacillus sp. FSL R10-2199]|uniref:hypothetical protein n=1 Tax=Paenibacillus sp. FSL R10-2199 TaxID=2975348 RepID=UPI000A8E1C7E